MASSPVLRPRALYPGAKIGIVSPSSPVKLEDLEAGIACFRERGYDVEVAPHAREQSGNCGLTYTAGADEMRAADLNSFFERDDIHAIVCTRGGYGAGRLLNRLDWQTMAAHHKLFVGYSDLTAIHLGLSGVSFYGPMAAAHANLNDVSRDQFWRMFESSEAYGRLPADPTSITTISGGKAQGELAGGCLSLLASSCGTRFAPQFAGKIVLIEDVGDPLYRSDRGLWQLRNSGAFDGAAGVVIGSLTNWHKFDAEPPLNRPETLFTDYFSACGVPVICGFPFGHEPNPLTLPLGVRAELDADNKTLTLLDAAAKD